MQKDISKPENEWKDIVKGLQVILAHYITDINENGISNNDDNIYVSIATKFITELTNELI